MKKLAFLIKLSLISNFALASDKLADESLGKASELQELESIAPRYNYSTNTAWESKDTPLDFYKSPYQISLFSAENGEDSDRLWSQTKPLMIGAVGIAGIIMLMPEDVSNWDGVSFSKWADNVKEGPTWDRDTLWLNWIGHPYFGGVYYQVARKSGYRQWDAFLYSFMMSSFYWEYGVEAFAEVPSMQDLVITPVLGWVYGEWAYQTEMELRKNGGTVWGSKILGDIALYSLDPVDSVGRGINRLFDTEVVKAGTGSLNFVQAPIANGEYENQVQLNVSYQLGSGKGYIEPNNEKSYISHNQDPVDTGVVGIGYSFGNFAPGNYWGLESGMAQGWNLGLYFSPRFSMKLDYLVADLKVKNSNSEQSFEQFNVGANYYFNTESNLRPFVTAGLGQMLYAEDKEDVGDNTFALNAGAGVHYKINNNFALQLDAKRYFNSKYSNQDDAFNLSLIYFFW
jgi:opacity protein-like surface antigen